MNDQIQKLQQLATTELGMTTAQLKPLIKVPGGGVQIRDTAGHIYQLAGTQGKLFYHHGMVAKLHQIDNGELPVLSILEPAAARSEFENYGRFWKAGKNDGQEVVLNESDAKAILHCDISKQYLPNIRGLLNGPIPMLHDGKLHILQEGYNKSCGFLVASGSIVEPDTLEEAVNMIHSVIVDFSFQTEPDRSRAVAAILTPALKLGGFIKGHTPIHFIEATESQTGKGFFLKLRNLVYGEIGTIISQQKDGVGSFDERFGSALLKGRPFIELDNFRGELKSATLESFLTNPGRFAVRTPYAKEQFIDGSIHFVSVSSNGMTTTEDLANRASFIRLKKEPDRDFSLVQGKSIDELIITLQPHFIGAITKILRHYHAKGMPQTGEKRHDFREWAQKLDWIVQNIFELEPLIDGNQEAQSRVQNQALGFVRALAIEVQKAGRLGEHFRAQELANLCDTMGVNIPGLNIRAGEEFDGVKAARCIGTHMKAAFIRADELIFEGFRVVRENAGMVSAQGNTFNGHRYSFELVNAPTADPTAKVTGDEALNRS